MDGQNKKVLQADFISLINMMESMSKILNFIILVYKILYLNMFICITVDICMYMCINNRSIEAS